jgi:uncharacterized protein YndB with AHSA1/START domain
VAASTSAAIAVTKGERSLTLTRVFDAPRNLVFRSWTRPELTALWWGPQGFVTLSCKMDVREGGA